MISKTIKYVIMFAVVFAGLLLVREWVGRDVLEFQLVLGIAIGNVIGQMTGDVIKSVRNKRRTTRRTV